MHQVLYYSRGGNTKKLADAIAGELGARATEVGAAAIDPEGVVFLGSGVYGGKPHEDFAKFVGAHDFKGRKVALFSTSWMAGEKAFTETADTLKKKGAIVAGGYHCKGRAFIFNLGHPDQAELDAAKRFARETVKNG